MWRVLPARIWATFLTCIVALTTIGLLYWRGVPPNEQLPASEFFLALFSAITPTFLLVIFLGSAELPWRIACKLIPKWHDELYISGRWIGKTRSNHVFKGAKIEEESKEIKGTNWHEYDLELEIVQTFLDVKITTRRPRHHTLGSSYLAKVEKGAHGFQYYYMFESANFQPGPNEDKNWFGAAEFRYDKDGKRILGRYCTNQNYTKLSSGTTNEKPLGPVAGDFFAVRPEE